MVNPSPNCWLLPSVQYIHEIVFLVYQKNNQVLLYLLYYYPLSENQVFSEATQSTLLQAKLTQEQSMVLEK